MDTPAGKRSGVELSLVRGTGPVPCMVELDLARERQQPIDRSLQRSVHTSAAPLRGLCGVLSPTAQHPAAMSRFPELAGRGRIGNHRRPTRRRSDRLFGRGPFRRERTVSAPTRASFNLSLGPALARWSVPSCIRQAAAAAARRNPHKPHGRNRDRPGADRTSRPGRGSPQRQRRRRAVAQKTASQASPLTAAPRRRGRGRYW